MRETWVPMVPYFVGSVFKEILYKNYFTSSDPHHDMLGEGCQVGVVRVNWKCYFPNS